MSAPAPQRAARNFSPSPKRTLSRTSRVIKYIFLDSCRNIPASHNCCFPLPEYHSTVFTLLKHLEEQAKDSGHFLASKKRLPVFQQLCGEVVPGVALGDVHLQNSSRELKELPDAKAPREDTKG
ncbi:hypothetical protein N321_02994 [Antrostomus carolinensis]|uniref:Uncharacterized protein n=1 Tax=Antrostomus carolinensis TaxID=279965 RepID=A0A094L421_ANTCR|nr:hypothetical protein N321_02994 [Antrostomus carolinensis]